MTENSNITISETDETPQTNFEHVAGVLNIILGIVLFVDGILLGIVAVFCFVMSFSLFFMAAIPAFFVIGGLCLLAFGAAIANLIAGIGSIVISNRGGTVSIVFSAVTMVVDTAVIPANAIAMLCGVYLLYTEVTFLSILIFIVATVAVGLAIASLVLSIMRFVKNKKI